MSLRFFVLSSALLLLAVGLTAAFPGELIEDLVQGIDDDLAIAGDDLGKEVGNIEEVVEEDVDPVLTGLESNVEQDVAESKTVTEEEVIPEVEAGIEGLLTGMEDGFKENKEKSKEAKKALKNKLKKGNSVIKANAESVAEDTETEVKDAVAETVQDVNSTDVGVKGSAAASTEEKPTATEEPKNFFQKMMSAFHF